jgi:hypothetical protein
MFCFIVGFFVGKKEKKTTLSMGDGQVFISDGQ